MSGGYQYIPETRNLKSKKEVGVGEKDQGNKQAFVLLSFWVQDAFLRTIAIIAIIELAAKAPEWFSMDLTH